MSNSQSNRIRTPNLGNALKDPKYVVLHYTASTNFAGTVAWLCDKRSRASAHFVLDRTGELDALVPLDRVAWHAGQSSWKGRTGLNSCSIGIELINAGPLRKDPVTGQYKAIVGSVVIPEDQVVEARHKSGAVAWNYWQTYTEAQLAALDNLLGQLFHDFPTLVEVVGHEDVSFGRKFDPGPAFEKHMVELKKKFDRY